MRRFTRLTNGHSKKVENHAAAIAVHFAYYNFCRVHMTLGKGEDGKDGRPPWRQESRRGSSRLRT